MKKQTKTIEIQPIDVKYASITIEGDGDLILNQMNARTVREMTAKQNNKKTVNEVPNVWEDIATSIHWRDPYPVSDTYSEMTEEVFHDMLRNNAPCITAFGLKKSFMAAVVRNEIDTYSTKFDNAMNVIAKDGLVPITFASHKSVEKLIPAKANKVPVLARHNYFSGWSATFTIQYTENVYSLEQIVNIIKLAGFGLGIGSGRSSGFGRYHISEITAG